MGDPFELAARYSNGSSIQEVYSMLTSRKAQLFVALFATPFIIVLGLLVYRAIARELLRAQTAITSPNGIDSLEVVELNGVQQSILIRGQDRTRPVLLWLHGGPGQPTMMLAHRHDQELMKHFVVVHWDQRGAGKSFHAALRPESLTPEQLVADVYALVLMLRERFDAPKIYLIGHSWGSELGALTVARYPALFYAYIGVGQAVSIPQGYALVYPELIERARAAGNQDALRQLEELGPPPYTTLEQLTVIGSWMASFGGLSQQSGRSLLEEALLSPAYSLCDVYSYIQGVSFSVTAMRDDLDQIDLFTQVPQIDVPVYLLHGRHDMASPAALVERYYNALIAPQGKQLIWFEESAHTPPWEQPALFQQTMNRVLTETYIP
jgi:pimeloyl-ACP methyl ester carboxylesterase